jgi:hypothetical protein
MTGSEPADDDGRATDTAEEGGVGTDEDANVDADAGTDVGTDTDVDAGSDVGTHADTDVDTGALVDALLAADVLDERADGTLVTTEAFERTRDIYHDTYADVSETVFRESVASAFDLPVDEAGERIEEEGVTRETFVDYLSVTSHTGDDDSRVDRARMAAIVGRATPDTPVPASMPELDDDSYERWLATHERAAVFVWKRACAPCDSLKRDVEEVLDGLPADVAVAGVDGESVTAFRRTFDVEAAPSILLLVEGTVREELRGYVPPEQVAAAAERAYGPD